ncbi:unnamed protein product [Mesocestoides corti]|uniref:Ras-associating domain-containing protein n=1 Tax=Mesocestoides corti TaxID=53468 RepID=A0A158QSX6_MESCO|nr:unnamed protein product [Mesocestoides corti]
MYSPVNRRNKVLKGRLVNLKNRSNRNSFVEGDEFPSGLSTWASQTSLYSTVSTTRTFSRKRGSLFHFSAINGWNSLPKNLEPQCQDHDGKVTLRVYNEDGTYKTILIDEDMSVKDVCEIMLQKNHCDDSIINWQLYEEPGEFPGFERQIEDHEFAMDLQRRWPASMSPSKIWFRQNSRKYNLSDGMERMILRTDIPVVDQLTHDAFPLPGLAEGVVLLKRPQRKWVKVFCFLLMSSIFFTRKAFRASKRKAEYLLDLANMDVYVPQANTEVTRFLNTPTPHTLLLVPSSIGLLDPEAVFAIGLKTRESLLAWAEGLRYHKHGRRKLSSNLTEALGPNCSANDRNTRRREKYRQTTEPVQTLWGCSDSMWTSVDVQCSPKVLSERPDFSSNKIAASTPKNIRRSILSQSEEVLDKATTDLGYQANQTPMATRRSSWLLDTPTGNELNGSGLNFPKEDEFAQNLEGIIFNSGKPALLLDLQSEAQKFPIEAKGFRLMVMLNWSLQILDPQPGDTKRYKLPFRPEKFETLEELCRFYESRRDLLYAFELMESLDSYYTQLLTTNNSRRSVGTRTDLKYDAATAF